MTRLTKSVLFWGVLLVALSCLFTDAAEGAKWSVHVHGGWPAYRGTYGHGPYSYGYGYPRAYGYYYSPRVYYPHSCGGYYSGVHGYGAPVVVPAPTVGVYYGTVRGPRPVVRYHVW